MTGVIKNFFRDKGFGFIQSNNGDVYYHINDIINKSILPEPGMTVDYKIVETPKGSQAKKIALSENIRVSKFLAFGDIRIKISNIKNYGIENESKKYLAQVNGFKNKKRSLLDAIEVAELELEGSRRAFDWAADLIKRDEMRVQYEKSRLSEALCQNKKDLESIEYSLALQDQLEYLYITTYQNDNFKFYGHACGFDIRAKITEIDNLLC